MRRREEWPCMIYGDLPAGCEQAPPTKPVESAPAFVIPTGAVKFVVTFPADRTLRKLIDRLAYHVAKVRMEIHDDDDDDEKGS